MQSTEHNKVSFILFLLVGTWLSCSSFRTVVYTFLSLLSYDNYCLFQCLSLLKVFTSFPHIRYSFEPTLSLLILLFRIFKNMYALLSYHTHYYYHWQIKKGYIFKPYTMGLHYLSIYLKTCL